MGKFEILDELVEKGNGYLTTAEVVKNGVSKTTLKEYVCKRNMERVAQGVYLAPDAWSDELYLLSLLNGRIVFSHETALYLHELTDREPKRISVSVKIGYNATHLRKRGVCVYQVKEEYAQMGATEIKTNFGNTVRVYDPERTICDIIRRKDEMDIQIFQYAIKEYLASGGKNINRLMDYAKKFQIESVVRTYTEILL